MIAAVTPPESDEARMKARANAQAAAVLGGWFAIILDHHLLLEDAFAAIRAARDASSPTAALKHLGVIMTGHAIAEEAVVYPGFGEAGEKSHATTGYNEQVMVKMQMAMLEKPGPMSQDFEDKLEHTLAVQTASRARERTAAFRNLQSQRRNGTIGAVMVTQNQFAEAEFPWTDANAVCYHSIDLQPLTRDRIQGVLRSWAHRRNIRPCPCRKFFTSFLDAGVWMSAFRYALGSARPLRSTARKYRAGSRPDIYPTNSEDLRMWDKSSVGLTYATSGR